jgi:hypothetical protein
MRFFGMFTEGSADPRGQALNQLIQFLLIDQAAQRNNLALTVQERSELAGEAVEMMEFYEMIGMTPPNISNERVAEFMSVEILAERLMDIYTSDLVIDEEDLEHAFLSHLLFNRADFVQMELKFIEVFAMEDSLQLVEELTAAGPEGIDGIIMREMLANNPWMEELEDDELEIPTVWLHDLRQDPEFDPMVLMQLASLEEGEVSEPMLLGHDFVIFIANSVEVPPEEEIEAVFREQFIQQQREMMFFQVLGEWHDAADIRINERGVNAA